MKEVSEKKGGEEKNKKQYQWSGKQTLQKLTSAGLGLGLWYARLDLLCIGLVVALDHVLTLHIQSTKKKLLKNDLLFLKKRMPIDQQTTQTNKQTNLAVQRLKLGLKLTLEGSDGLLELHLQLDMLQLQLGEVVQAALHALRQRLDVARRVADHAGELGLSVFRELSDSVSCVVSCCVVCCVCVCVCN